MKKRLIAALVLVTLVIGLCGTIAAAAETPEYQVGYAKVDINPYYSARFENYLKEKLPTYNGKWLDLEYGDMMPLSLQGNSHTKERLTIGKQDDNGDGIVDELDGVYVTCIAITDPNGETVILLGTDMINGNENCVGAVRKALYDKYHITGDRVMMDGSHNHHAPDYTGDSGLKNSKSIDDNAAYWLQMAWGEYLREKLVEAVDVAMADRQAAKLEKGTIEAEGANCASQPIGDTLNAIRKENKTKDPKYGDVEYVTVLEPNDNNVVGETWKNSNGETCWTDSEGVKHVATPSLFPNRRYNAVRHYLQTSEQAKIEASWANTSPFYAFSFPKYTAEQIANGEAPAGFKVKDYIPANNGTEITYVAGDNCNGVVSPGEASAVGTIWMTKGDGTINYKESQIVSADQVEEKAAVWTDALLGRVDGDAVGKTLPYKKGTWTRVYKYPKMYVASSVDHVSEVDDTLLVLKFDIIDENYADILLVNWRSHTNKSRSRSLDYRKEYTDIGFYDSFYQISSDWINAFRYTLEQAGYRVAYFSGASGNVNTASRLERFGGWQSWKETAGAIHVFKKAEVGTTVEVNTLEGKTSVEVTEDMVGYCYQTKWLGLDCNDSNIITDASHAKNAGAIYGSELAEVALELLSGTNSTYKMQKISNPTGGIRSVQTLYRTERKSISVEEFLAAGIYHKEDMKDGISNNKSGTASYTVGYWIDENGDPIVDKNGVCSMLDEAGSFVDKVDKDGNLLGGQYSQTDLDTYGYGQPVEWKTGTGTIASYLHANAAPRFYDSQAAGTQVELNAILLCDQIALITAPGEMYDRYGYTDDPNGEKIYWTKEGPANINSHNSWLDLWDEDTYGEPFFLGYCNDSTGYMPSRVTYDYSKDVPGKVQGSYGVNTTSFAQGTGEDVILEFGWLLDQAMQGGTGSALPAGQKAYCEHCGMEQNWISLAAYIDAYVDAGHTTILNQGHYYVPDNMEIDGLTIKGGAVCLDLNGKELLGEERVFTVAANGILNIQDSSQGKTGTMAGQGFHDYSTGSGAAGDPFRGAAGGTIYLSGEMNLYSGTLTTKVTNEYKPGNGGVVNVAGTGVLNMHGGAIASGVSGWAGGNIYGDIGSHLNLEGGSITGGISHISGTKCIMAKGTVCLSNDASVNLLQLWPETQGEPAQYADMLTIKGYYTGKTQVSIKGGATVAKAGLDIGTGAGARFLSENLTIKEDSKLTPVVEGNDLVLRNVANVSERYCEHCKAVVKWTKLSADAEAGLVADHYYVDENNYVMTEQKVSTALCLDLNGMTVKGDERAFEVKAGGVLSIQDSSTEKTGILAGQGFTTGTGSGTSARGAAGGTVNVANGGTLNLYSGTLTLEVLEGRYNPGNGGVVYTAGTFNMHGGTVRDGISGWVGGNIFVEKYTMAEGKKACFHMYGGAVSGGECTNIKSLGSVVIRGYVTLSGDASVNKLSLFKPTSGYAPLGDMLTVKDTYTGTTEIHLYNVENVAEGLDVGNSENGVISRDAKLTVSGKTLQVAVEGTDLVLRTPKAAALVTLGGAEQSYDTVDAAAADCQSPSEKDGLMVIPQTVKLLADAEELTFTKTVVLDLNGHNVDRVIASGEEVTVYCMDSANVTTKVEDGKEVYEYHADRCGVVKETEGEGDVEAAPAAVYTKDNKDVQLHTYLALPETDGTSFHAVCLSMRKAFLRPSWSGMYFGAEFGGDERIVALVDTFGVAMSVEGAPSAETMGETAQFTELKNDGVDSSFGDASLLNVENILSNIMKKGLSTIDNYVRSKTNVYVRAYLKTTDGDYVFGNTAKKSLKTLTEDISDRYITPEGDHSKLTAEQWNALKEMYGKYPKVMNKWDIPNLQKALQNEQQ